MAFQTMSGIPKVTSTANFYSNTNPLLQSRGIGGFAEPLSLFGAGEQGAWWDFSDLTVMFQDSAGTVPAALESPVGKVLDKSGKNNHLVQATAGARPTLSRKYNIFTESEFRNGIADAPTRGGLVTAASINGFAGAVAFGYDGATTSFAYKAQSVTVGLSYKISVIVQMDIPGIPVFGGAETSPLTDFALTVGNSQIPPATYVVEPAGVNLYRVSATVASAFSTSSNNGVVKNATNSSRTFKVTAYDLRLASDAALAIPQYQRTQTADYDTLGFPAYLLFDGATKWMQSAGTVDFTGANTLTTIAAATKLSDAASAPIVESSTIYSANPGAFAMWAPLTALPNFALSGGGTANTSAVSPSTYVSPVTDVVSGVLKIAVPSIDLYVNNSLSITNNATQGTGNFGNYTCYVGARAGTSLFYTGRMYGLILRGADTNTNDLSMTNKWMGSKCGLFF